MTTKYYHKNKERLKTKARKDSKNLFEEEKTKSVSMLLIDIEIFL